MGKAVEFCDVSFSYSNSSEGIKDINVVINEGEKVALIGNGGSGKSTFIYCINRLIPDIFKGEFTGEIFLNSVNIKEYTKVELVQKVSIILENFRMQRCSSTVEKEVVFGMENLGIDVKTIESELDKIVDVFAIKELLERPMKALSGGQCQKAIIASFFILKTPIICLDNAASELDEENKKMLYEVIDEYKRIYNITSIIVENDPRYFSDFDRILVFDNGRIIGNITPDELVRGNAWSNYFDFEKMVIPQICFHYEIPLPRDLTLNNETIQYLKSKLITKDFKCQEVRKLKNTGIVMQIENGKFKYDNTTILNNVNLAIYENDIIGIIGKNGQGKSTLLKILCGLLKLDSGEFFSKINSFGVVFQNVECQLYETSVCDEIRQFIADEIKVKQLLEEVGLEKKCNEDPLLLSKGEQKRLAIATMLAQDKRIILLDEPTSGLSGQEKRKLKIILKQLHEDGKTIVMVSHDLDFVAQVCHKVSIIYNQMVIDIGDVKNVFKERQYLMASGMQESSIVQLSRELGTMTFSLSEFYEKYEKK